MPTVARGNLGISIHYTAKKGHLRIEGLGVNTLCGFVVTMSSNYLLYSKFAAVP